MQVLLLPLLIIRMIVSIIMSITTMSFLSQSRRRMEQAHLARYPGQVQRPAAKSMSGKSLVLILAIVAVCMFVAIQGPSNGAPQAAPTTSADTAPPCQVTKHSKTHLHHKAPQPCSAN